MNRRLRLLMLLISLSPPCFALDALQSQRGEVFYGNVEVRGDVVDLTHPNGWTEQFDAHEVRIIPDFTTPKPKIPQKEGNFEIIPGNALQKPINPDSFRSAMCVSLNLNRWNILWEEAGILHVSYQTPQMFLKIRIVYGPEGYWYEYVESKGLQALPSLNRIQQNYFQLIQQLDRQLQVYYAQT